MSSRTEITRKDARAYVAVSNTDKGLLVGEVVTPPDWSRTTHVGG